MFAQFGICMVVNPWEEIRARAGVCTAVSTGSFGRSGDIRAGTWCRPAGGATGAVAAGECAVSGTGEEAFAIYCDGSAAHCGAAGLARSAAAGLPEPFAG